jgi:hypothetical protein
LQDTSISSERKQLEEFLIRFDLQQVENKLQYNRSLNEESKALLKAFAQRREQDLADLQKL